MITFPSLPVITTTESPPAAATAVQAQALPLFAELLAIASGKQGAAAGGKGLPQSGPELPLPGGGAAIALPGAETSVEQTAEALVPAVGILATESLADRLPATQVTAAATATPEPEPGTLPLPVGSDPALVAGDAEELPAARAPSLPLPGTASDSAPVSAAVPTSVSVAMPVPAPAPASASTPASASAPAAAPASVPAPPGISLADLAVPPAAPEVATARPEALVPVAPGTSAAQGEAPALSMVATAAVAPDAPLQPQPRPQLPVSLPLQHAPQDPGFSGELASRLQVFARNGIQEATLQLHPAELGRLQVSISTDGDQARVVFVADNAAARDAIEQSMPRLRELLAQSGLQLAHSDVSGQSQAGGQRGNSATGTSGFQESDAGLALAAGDAPAADAGGAGSYLVDYYI